MIEGIWSLKWDNDFGPGTLIEIEDVANLIKALFRINVHIAHDEYYLRQEEPEGTSWWYGDVVGEDVDGTPHLICGTDGQIVCNPSADQIVCNMTNFRQISFEPTVDLKFSNFHSAN